jgi:hypothetical protein
MVASPLHERASNHELALNRFFLRRRKSRITVATRRELKRTKAFYRECNAEHTMAENRGAKPAHAGARTAEGVELIDSGNKEALVSAPNME